MVIAFSLQSYVFLLLLSPKLKQVEAERVCVGYKCEPWSKRNTHACKQPEPRPQSQPDGSGWQRHARHYGRPPCEKPFPREGEGACTYILLGEVYEVLQVNVVSVRPDVIVNKEIQLVFDPVFENKRQHPSSELQEENNPQEHRKLREKKHTTGNGHRG